jgi:hypothetical protein
MNKKTRGTKKPFLAAGQLWQMKDHYVQITRVGKTLAEYKLLRKPGQRAVQAQMGSVAKVSDFLKTNRAKLESAPDKAP